MLIRGKRMPGALAGALALGALTIAACGGSDEAPESDAPPVTEFPAPKGQTLSELAGELEPADDLVILPAGQVINPGEARIGFGVFTNAREPINDAELAIYAAQGARGTVKGPFPARVDSLATAPAYASESTSTDPDAPDVVYVTELDIDADGEWQFLAVVNEGGTLKAARMPSIVAGRFQDVPAEGDRAPKVETPTADDVGGDLTKIDTRNPPSSMHEEDFADVLGKKPAVLLFATPSLCQSRVCGPVVDVTEQVKDETEDDVAFIHMEIFKDNQFDKGPRPQVQAFNLPTEPWLFVVDKNGTIDTAIEGAFSADELRDAVAKVAG